MRESRVERSERGRCDRAGSIVADDNDTNSHCHFGYRGGRKGEGGIRGLRLLRSARRVADAGEANKTSRH